MVLLANGWRRCGGGPTTSFTSRDEARDGIDRDRCARRSSLDADHGVSLLAGVGFTMSIFIANLAFGDTPALLDSAKVGILSGSLLAGLTGYLLLRLTCKKSELVSS